MLQRKSSKIRQYSPELPKINSSSGKADEAEQTLAATNGQSSNSTVDQEVDQKGEAKIKEIKMCVNHPTVEAVVKCKICRTYICNTCDFSFPGGIHVCPKCVVAVENKISKKRKKYLIWSYILAGLSTFFLFLFFSALAGADSESEAESIGVGFFYLIFLTAITGTVLGFNAIDRRLKNPMSIWIAPLWNLIILAVLVLISITGILMG